jgi:hypothetical protein
MITDALEDALQDQRSGIDNGDDVVARMRQALPAHLSDLLRAFCAKHGEVGMRQLMDRSWLRNRMDPSREAPTSLATAPLVPIAETSPLPTRSAEGPRRRPEGIHSSCCCIL